MPNAAFNNHITNQITISVWVNWANPETIPDEHNRFFSVHGESGAEYKGILGVETGWPDGDLSFWDTSEDAFYPGEGQGLFLWLSRP